MSEEPYRGPETSAVVGSGGHLKYKDICPLFEAIALLEAEPGSV